MYSNILSVEYILMCTMYCNIVSVDPDTREYVHMHAQVLVYMTHTWVYLMTHA